MRYVAVLKEDNNIILDGDVCCTNLQELYIALVDINTTEIEITKEFANEYFTYSALSDFVTYSAALAPNVTLVLDDSLYDSDSQAVKALKDIKLSDELIYALECNPTKVLSTIQMLCDYYFETHEENVIANTKIANMRVSNSSLQSKINQLEKDKRVLEDTTNDLYARLHSFISRANFRYEKTIEPHKAFLATENKYNHILYIKEITRVHYTDTLLYYLSEILKTLYGVPIRTVVVEPFYSYGREKLYPMFTPHWQLTYRDVYSGDIFMAGYQPHLMEDILRNSSHVNYLVVLDRGGYQAPHIDSTNVTYVYAASDLQDIKFDVEKNKIISYDESTLYIPYIDKFNELSPESKVQKYSSMNVTKTLIDYLEEVK